jgi:putative ABC transport system permease protein
MEVDPGFNPKHILTIQTWLPDTRCATADQRIAFFRQVLDRVQVLPGVVSAAATSSVPLNGFAGTGSLAIEGEPIPPPGAAPSIPDTKVTENYFRTMQIRLVRGRYFTQTDTATSQHVVIVNEAFARTFFPGRNCIGRRIGSPDDWSSIVGIVGDVRHLGLEQTAVPEVFSPYPQAPVPFMTLAIRTALNALDLVPAVRSQIQVVDKDQPIYDVATMDQRLDRSIASRRFNMVLLGIFASIALALATVGVYGVMAYSVTQRRHEIGIQMALGATAGDVLRLVMHEGLVLTVIGIATGLALSLALTRFLSNLLYGIRATDTFTFILTSLLLSGVAILASSIPAWRATRANPMVVLRHE